MAALSFLGFLLDLNHLSMIWSTVVVGLNLYSRGFARSESGPVSDNKVVVLSKGRDCGEYTARISWRFSCDRWLAAAGSSRVGCRPTAVARRVLRREEVPSPEMDAERELDRAERLADIDSREMDMPTFGGVPGVPGSEVREELREAEGEEAISEEEARGERASLGEERDEIRSADDTGEHKGGLFVIGLSKEERKERKEKNTREQENKEEERKRKGKYLVVGS